MAVRVVQGPDPDRSHHIVEIGDNPNHAIDAVQEAAVVDHDHIHARYREGMFII